MGKINFVHTEYLNEDRTEVKLVKKSSAEFNGDGFKESNNIIDFLKEQLPELALQSQEHFYLICTDTKHIPKNISLIGKGSIDACVTSVKHILQIALLTNTAKVVIVHNHPSGNSVPSNTDVESTKRIGEALNLMGITLLDHIILGDTYFSMKSNNLL